MNITVVSGVGEGLTDLAAFNAALIEAGIAGYNLIPLSSIIPAKAKIIFGLDHTTKLIGEWGDRLYIVIAQQRTILPGKKTWAGLGWVQDKKSGKGLFVEHNGFSRQQVVDHINSSLKSIMSSWSEMKFGETQMLIRGITYKENPVCALVVAVFPAQGWV